MSMRLFGFAAALSLAGAALADVTTVNASIPATDTNWSKTLALPQFNMPGYHLDSLDIAFKGSVQSTIQIENRSIDSNTYTATASYLLNLTGPSGASLLTVKPTAEPITAMLPAYDGVTDFGGTSGVTRSDLKADSSGTVTLTNAADLAAFVGTGSVSLPVSASASATITASANATKLILTQASADVAITYHYSPDAPVLGSLGDRVWFDANANGKQDDGEHGVAGLGVQLLDANGTVLKTTTTDADGGYLFTDLASGAYRVQFSKPSGYRYTTTDAGSDDTVDSDADGSGLTAVVNLGAGEDRLDVDAGLVGTLCLGDRVWKDLDRDGLQDSCEPGVAGVGVHLLDANGTVIADATTDGNGYYRFTNLAPGDYSVSFDAPTGYGFTKQFADTRYKQYDSNVDPATGVADVTLTANDATIDAGLVGAQKIGDTVWLDADGDGKYEPELGEKGIPGVKVALLGDVNGDGWPDVYLTTTTDSNGKYLFNSLLPGNYMVTVVSTSLPYGLTPTYDLDGTWTRNFAVGKLLAGTDRLDFDFGYTKASTCTPRPCGWWSCNPGSWNGCSVNVGGKNCSKPVVTCFLKKNACGDNSITLCQALIAAKLNIAQGCSASSAVTDAIKKADAWICAYGVGTKVPTNCTAWTSISAACATLDKFNNCR